MKKNWKAIAGVSNPQIQLALIQAVGSDAEALARAYPGCFEGEETPMTRDEFMGIVAKLRRSGDVIAFCREVGVPYRDFRFRGHRRGSTPGVPYSDGGYTTVACGPGEYFFSSEKKQGETLEFEGATWLVAWAGSFPGSPEQFAVHSMVIVPTLALAD